MASSANYWMLIRKGWLLLLSIFERYFARPYSVIHVLQRETPVSTKKELTVAFHSSLRYRVEEYQQALALFQPMLQIRGISTVGQERDARRRWPAVLRAENLLFELQY
jgi:hypothetical protein